MIALKKLTLSLSLVALLSACNPQAPAENKPKELDLSTDEAQLAYTIGAQMAGQLDASKMFSKLDLDALFAAFKDTAEGKEMRMTFEEMQQAQINFEQQLQAERDALSQANIAKGNEYLAEYAKKEGVLKTESGLLYEILREGKGDAKPTAQDTVKVHYSGKLLNGEEFDSSYTRGEPADFPVSGVIPGFSEGLQLMTAGAKYRFTIPSELAYGLNAPAAIGPNQVLVFEVELIEIVSAGK